MRPIMPGLDPAGRHNPMIGRIFLGRYETTRLLGEGGMGRAYLARQIDLDRQVVVKVMHDHIAADAKFRERFQRETFLMAKFAHPNAVTLYDASLNDPLGPCIIMEYVRGVNLDALLVRNGRFTPARVGRLVGQLCDVLQAAHDQGFIHRDLKPANLMVQDSDSPRERIKVMDFGLAKMLDASTLKKVTDTHVDGAIGTPGYICPEQVRGEDMDHRGDLYSVGVLMYELLTGRLPFVKPTSMDMLLAHATELPPTFEELELEQAIAPEVEAVVMRCLAKHPEDRPQSARELADELDAALRENPSYGLGLSEAPAPLPEGEHALPPDRPFATHWVTPENDPTALLFTLEAWMPERVALVKLRGFVHDLKGEVTESVPGLVRVRLPFGRPASQSGRFSWFGLSRKAAGTELELRLSQSDPERENLLQVSALFRSADGTPPTDKVWRARCVQTYINLRGYLMGQTEAV